MLAIIETPSERAWCTEKPKTWHEKGANTKDLSHMQETYPHMCKHVSIGAINTIPIIKLGNGLK
jgi:hypothetical protein